MQGATKAQDQAFPAQRRAMVDGQLRTFAVTDPEVIAAFLAVPREIFLPEALRPLAYSDAALTLQAEGGAERLLLQPMILGRLMQGAAMTAGTKVLIVGGGTGYAACVAARIAQSVLTLDTETEWAEAAEAQARALGLVLRAVTGRLPEGFGEGGPYDVILVQGAIESGFEPLLGQLAPGGRLVTIEGRLGGATRRVGKAVAFRRFGDDVSVTPLFEATAPVLDEFRRPAEFVF